MPALITFEASLINLKLNTLLAPKSGSRDNGQPAEHASTLFKELGSWAFFDRIVV